MSQRGRPPKSEIRQQIVEILYFMKEGHGYDIYRIHSKIFPHVTMRSIYYHLKKGVALEELRVKQIKSEKGSYSWGQEAEKVYYELGKNASPRINARVKGFFDKKNI